MKAARTLHELRRGKECLFACKSYDMRELMEAVATRRVSWAEHIFINNCLLGGVNNLKKIYVDAPFGINPSCDTYKFEF